MGEIVLEAVTQNPAAFHFAAPSLRGDPDVQACAMQSKAKLEAGRTDPNAVMEGGSHGSTSSQMSSRPTKSFALIDWACESLRQALCSKACGLQASSASECSLEVEGEG